MTRSYSIDTPLFTITSESAIYITTDRSRKFSLILDGVEYRSDSVMHVRAK